MSALSVWTYPHAGGARRLERTLTDGTLGDLAVADGAVVTWARGRASAQVRELQGVARTCNLGTAFWGMLFGIVVSGPELATVGGARRPALDDSLEGVGIDRDTLIALRRRLRPGGSAVAVICAEAVASAIESVRPSVVIDLPAAASDAGQRTTRPLTEGQEQALRRIFAS
ncbi:DUF1269 domain-containing protein [Microbacterium sp. RU33B]|uniref:DUF1269 domain-containing protein n=1 Tax=Microbacterium sp. RU33B TaxID=1907390 RepID=UPI0009641805|nr:DUF1269 domain-containing protein [Microbacterium sp. RU33B]SIT66567.1 Uncharacterized membrane protein [Microbacterium sp. RU33B]